MRLAWWRDELAKPVELRPDGDAVLDAIGSYWAGEEPALVALVDGWELLLVEPPLSQRTARDFVTRRAEPFAILTRLGGTNCETDVRKAGAMWAAVDAAVHSSDDTEKAAFLQLANEISSGRLPRPMRGIAVLTGLARRAINRGDPSLMAGRTGALAALRLGIFGR